MNCPQCNGERIEAENAAFQLARDVHEYRLRCLDCGHRWARRHGTMRRPTAEWEAEWANVVHVPNAWERKEEEDRAKIERGECPECGAALVEGPSEDMGHLIKRRRACARECGFKMSSISRKEDA